MTDTLMLLSQVDRQEDLPRSGWLRRGLLGGESVAVRCFRTTIPALLLAPKLAADAVRLLEPALVRDLLESDTDAGDITPRCGVSLEM